MTRFLRYMALLTVNIFQASAGMRSALNWPLNISALDPGDIRTCDVYPSTASSLKCMLRIT